MKKETIQEKQTRSDAIFRKLRKAYPNARCTLEIHFPAQFLLAAILSPQCTDNTANKVSAELWKKFKSLEAISSSPIAEIEKILKPCGMYKVKSRFIKKSAQLLIEKYGGILPDTIDNLMEFPGVGRKVALVVLLEQFGKAEGIIIDTHNIRLSNRLGLTSNKDAYKIEKDLMKVVPEKYWRLWSHLMVHHGRSICTARSPKCNDCVLKNLCPAIL